ncbi:uncharacterized protein [Clytia hemisphaerica]|uniref:Uncharacterized protein n=1 Tax=Clytia hemisphaerica TaxID=252671 RepID=A0A7M6DNJ3_9CNID|eukprot:TCONS_00073544-protein
MELLSYYVSILVIAKSVKSQSANSMTPRRDRAPLGDCYQCGQGSAYNNKEACIGNQRLQPCIGPNKVCRTLHIYNEHKFPNGTTIMYREHYKKSCETADPKGCDSKCYFYRKEGRACKMQCCAYHACNQDVQFDRPKARVSESVRPALQYDSSASTLSATLISTLIILLHLI